MYLEWVKHLQSEEDKTKFKQRIYNSREVLDRLKDILIEKENMLDRSETSIETYSTPSWDYRQAHKNGNRETLAYLKKLIDLDQQRGM